jgi:putative DNA-invertase from lambdoid prophage Rac
MKVAIYCRVSTQEQTTENQRIRLIEYCERQGWQFEVIEEVESSRKTRPKKQELLNRLRHKEFDGVLVWKLDRWARSSFELLNEIEELTKKGIAFYSMSDNLDFSTSTGRLHFAILAAFAQFERDLIRERTLEGLNRAKSQGKTLGRPSGSKDKKDRRKSGYFLRHAGKKSPPVNLGA